MGAGPAGSTAAYRLASQGVSTLLVDRARFPRDKPCGGGLTARALRQLPFSIDAVVEDTVDTFEFGLAYGRRFTRRSALPLVAMTQRARLDAHLAERAAAAGAAFRDGSRAEDVKASNDGVRLTVDGRPVEAAVLVGADGANGRTSRAVGLAEEHDHAVALEGNVPYSAVGAARFRGRVFVELGGTVPGGYAWIFPKGDHINVGVGGWLREGPRLRAHLRRLCREHEIPEARIEALRGYRLPLRRRQPVAGLERVLLVGDAAGLVDPLSGDGMYEAFASARVASREIVELLEGRRSDLSAYGRLLMQELSPHISVSWATKLAFDRFPRAMHVLAARELAWGVVQRFLAAEEPPLGGVNRPTRAALGALEAFARRAGEPAAHATVPS